MEMAAVRSQADVELASGSYLIVFEGGLEAALRQKSRCAEGRLGAGDMLWVGADTVLWLRPTGKAALLLRFRAADHGG